MWAVQRMPGCPIYFSYCFPSGNPFDVLPKRQVDKL